MATDYRSGREFPRRGRDVHGWSNWILRLFAKSPSAQSRTIPHSHHPFPIHRAVFDLFGVNPREFDSAPASCPTDYHIVTLLNARVTGAARWRIPTCWWSGRTTSINKMSKKAWSPLKCRLLKF